MFKRRWLVAWRLIRSGNLKELLVRTFRFLKIRLKKKLKVDYSHWRKKWVEINDEDRKQIAIKIDSLPRLPSFTFILNSKKNHKKYHLNPIDPSEKKDDYVSSQGFRMGYICLLYTTHAADE